MLPAVPMTPASAGTAAPARTAAVATRIPFPLTLLSLTPWRGESCDVGSGGGGRPLGRARRRRARTRRRLEARDNVKGFEYQVREIKGKTRQRMTGVSWRPGCPVHIDNLRLIRTTFWDFDGNRETGSIVVHEDEAGEIVRVFRSLYRHKFKIRRMQLIDRYNASDHASMNADNTSGFNCRYIAGTSTLVPARVRARDRPEPDREPLRHPVGTREPARGRAVRRPLTRTTRAWSTAATTPTAPSLRRTGSGAATGPARRTTSTSRATAARGSPAASRPRRGCTSCGSGRRRRS